MLTLYTKHPNETHALGGCIGELLEPGDVLLLQGPLGAGKTALTKGIGAGAGSGDLVLSPTFVLVNEYAGRVKLYHADLYRLEKPDEILALDLPGYTTDGVLIVEWPERAEGLLPREYLLVQLDHLGGNERRLTLTAFGARAVAIIRALAGAASPADRPAAAATPHD